MGAQCTRCQGTGVFIQPIGSTAVAEVCECSRWCQICQGDGVVLSRDTHNREMAKRCECVDRRLRVRVYNESRVPAKFHDARLHDSQRDQQNFDAFNTFALLSKNFDPNDKGILLMGPPGVGKTHLVVGFLYEIVFRYGVHAKFQDFSDLLKRLRSGYSRDEPEETLIDPLVQAELLIVDELGKGRNNQWELNILDTLISARYNNRKTTIFTSNYTVSKKNTLVERVRRRDRPDEDTEIRDTLSERIGSRIYSRLHEMCHFISLDGADRREWDAEIQTG